MEAPKQSTNIDFSAVRVVVLATAFEPALEAGGTARAITNLVDELSPRYEVAVLAPDRDHGSGRPFPGLNNVTVKRGRALVHYRDVGDLRQLLGTLRMLGGMSPDYLVVNSVWHPRMALLPCTLRLLGLLRADVVILMPHGELDPGALALKRVKKRMAMPFVKLLYSQTVDFIGATSPREKDNVTDSGIRLPVILTDNIPDAIPFGSPSIVEGPLRLVFLGRVHPKKGLLQALEGIRLVEHTLHVTIAGPVEDPKYWDSCSLAVDQMPAWVTVEYVGTVGRGSVPGLLHEHDAMIGLTAGENFGYTFIEALQAGCPVIASDQTPWTMILRSGGGWVIEDRNNPVAVASAVSKIAMLLPEERLGLRRSAREAYENWARDRPANVIDQAIGLSRSAGTGEGKRAPRGTQLLGRLRRGRPGSVL